MAGTKRTKQTKTAPERGSLSLVTDSTHKLWLAGLGAAGRAGQEAQQVYGHLVGLGESIENAARGGIEARVRRAGKGVRDARGAFVQAWLALERGIRHRLGRILRRFDIPTARDVAELNHRVEILSVTLERIVASQEKAAAPPPAGRNAPKARRRSTRRKTPARKKAAG